MVALCLTLLKAAVWKWMIIVLIKWIRISLSVIYMPSTVLIFVKCCFWLSKALTSVSEEFLLAVRMKDGSTTAEEDCNNGHCIFPPHSSTAPSWCSNFKTLEDSTWFILLFFNTADGWGTVATANAQFGILLSSRVVIQGLFAKLFLT